MGDLNSEPKFKIPTPPPPSPLLNSDKSLKGKACGLYGQYRRLSKAAQGESHLQTNTFHASQKFKHASVHVWGMTKQKIYLTKGGRQNIVLCNFLSFLNCNLSKPGFYFLQNKTERRQLSTTSFSTTKR